MSGPPCTLCKKSKPDSGFGVSSRGPRRGLRKTVCLECEGKYFGPNKCHPFERRVRAKRRKLKSLEKKARILLEQIRSVKRDIERLERTVVLPKPAVRDEPEDDQGALTYLAQPNIRPMSEGMR